MAGEALREVFAHFGVEVDTAPLDKADGAVEGLIGQLRKLAGVVAGGALVQGLRNFVESTTDAFDNLGDTAAKLQISTDALQEWRFAAKLNGMEAGELDASIMALTRSLQGFSEGSDGPAKALRKLGVSGKDSAGQLKNFEQLIPEIADGIAKLPNETERAGVAIRLFGRNGMALLPLLSQGSEGIAKLRTEFQELGGGASQEAIAKMSEYRDQVDRANVALESMKSEIVLGLLPIWRFFSEAARRVSQAFAHIARTTRLLDVALGMAGAALAAFSIKAVIALAPVLAPILAIAAGVAAIALALDDLWVTFEGGESALQLFVDELYGVGTTAEIVDGLIMLWDDLVTSILEAGQAAKEFLGFGKASPVEGRGQKRARERQEIQDEAVRNGNLEDFTRSRQASGRISKEQIRGDFLERRRKMIASGEVKADENDVAAGLADKVGGKALAPKAAPLRLPSTTITASAPRSVARVAGGEGRGGKSVSVDARTSVAITLPPGADKALRESMRKAAQDVFDTQTRAAQAALFGAGDG